MGQTNEYEHERHKLIWVVSLIMSHEKLLVLMDFMLHRQPLLHLGLDISASRLIERSDYELFTKVCSGSHSLYHLLPPYRTSDLRLRGHPFQLPDY